MAVVVRASGRFADGWKSRNKAAELLFVMRIVGDHQL